VAFYWRYDLFFLWDDWTELDLISHNTFFNYLFLPNGEIYFPFFHLIFYALIKIVGENHGFFVLVNCLVAGSVACLLYLFLRIHFSQKQSLLISLLFAGSAVQPAIVWNAFYLCYILSLVFFLWALLLTDAYVCSPGYRALLPIGLCASLSIHSHNYTLLALLALPVYVLAVDGARGLRKALYLAGLLGVVILVFSGEYLLLAGVKSTTFFNEDVLSTIPDLTFIAFWICGAFLSPFYFLFWGHFQFPLWAIIFGTLVLGLCMWVIMAKGSPLERRLGLWALLLNALPFAMVSLGRYTFAYDYAFTARYVFFTFIGAMFVAGLAWTVISRRIAAVIRFRVISYVVILLMVGGQILSMPFWQKGYLQMSRKASDYYRAANCMANDQLLLVNPRHPLGAGQVNTIRQFLRNEVWLQLKDQQINFSRSDGG
jgi:hypothetical protein